MLALPILWADEDVIAVYKPGGMPTQPDPTGDPDLLSSFRSQCGEPALQVVHRLDRPVSGVVLFGRNSEAISALNMQFRERTVQKVYWAVVEGLVRAPTLLSGVVQRNGRTKRSHVRLDHAADARLEVTPLTMGERYTLVEVVPQGGAFHQIRALLSAAGTPIKGDVKYGARRGEKDRTIMLHARSIVFRAPRSQSLQTVQAPVPETSLWRTFAGFRAFP